MTKSFSKGIVAMGTLPTLMLLVPVLVGVAHADTNFLGGNLNSSGSWDNGLPASGNPGTIAVDGNNGSTVFNFGGGSVVHQTAGTITSGDGFNLTGGTWNMSGGTLSTRYFLSNGGSTVINLSGGLVELADRPNTQHMGVANGGTLIVSGATTLDGTEATTNVQTGGTVNFSSDWTGSWTWRPHSGTDWRDLLTTSPAMRFHGTPIRGETFDAFFVVSNAGKTLGMIPELTGSAPVARFDVNSSTGTGPSPTQTDWAPLGGSTHSTAAAQNGVTLTLTQNRNDRARDRGIGGNVAGSSVPEVFRDFTHGDTYSGANAQAKVHLEGLEPGKAYDLRWHHYENGSTISHNARVYENSVSADNLLFTATGFGNNTVPDATGYSEVSVTAKADGTIDLVTGSHLPGSAGTGIGDRSITYFNGLEIAPSSSEPTRLLDFRIAGWDVNLGDSTPVQNGFAALNGSVLDQTVASGPVTLTMTQERTDRARDSGGSGPAAASSLPDLFRDFTHADSGANVSTLSLLLNGLAPEAEYRMRWHHYESRTNPGDFPTSVYLGDSSALDNHLFDTIVTGNEGNPDAAGYSDFYVTTDADGSVRLVTGPSVTGGRSISYLNGLEIFQPVPEPSTGLLLMTGLLGLMFTRRRRR